jgi:hypothetical protein
MGAGLFTAGVVVGVAITSLRPESVVSAQASWQCRSWTLEAKDGVDAIGPWLAAATQVEISTAGLEVAGRYVLVACKR